ncbi:hypothetical protein D3C72_1080520 [compost metagenome]
MAERAGAELAFEHRLPIAHLLVLRGVVARVGVVAGLVQHAIQALVAAAVDLAEAVVGADRPVRVDLVAQARGVQLQVGVQVLVAAGEVADAPGHRGGQGLVGVGPEAEGRHLPGGAAVLVDRIEGPGQVLGQACVQAQRHRVALDVARVVGRAFLVRHVQAVAEHIVRAGAPAQVDVLAPDIGGAVAQFERGGEGVGRLLGDVVDDAARRGKAVHKARQALEQFHLLHMLVRQRDAVGHERQPVDLEAVLPVDLQATHAQVAGPAVVAVAVVADRRIHRKHIAQLGHLALSKVFAGDDGGGVRGVELRARAQRAGAGLFLKLQAGIVDRGGADGHRGQRLRVGGLLRQGGGCGEASQDGQLRQHGEMAGLGCAKARGADDWAAHETGGEAGGPGGNCRYKCE